MRVNADVCSVEEVMKVFVKFGWHLNFYVLYLAEIRQLKFCLTWSIAFKPDFHITAKCWRWQTNGPDLRQIWGVISDQQSQRVNTSFMFPVCNVVTDLREGDWKTSSSQETGGQIRVNHQELLAPQCNINDESENRFHDKLKLLDRDQPEKKRKDGVKSDERILQCVWPLPPVSHVVWIQ